MNKLKQKFLATLSSRKSDAYISVAVGMVCICMMLVGALNIFQFVTLRVHMDRVAEDMIEMATYRGGFDSVWDQEAEKLEAENGFIITGEAEEYYDSLTGKVQLGDKMRVTVQCDPQNRGFFSLATGILSVTRQGLSEHYWN